MLIKVWSILQIVCQKTILYNLENYNLDPDREADQEVAADHQCHQERDTLEIEYVLHIFYKKNESISD